jgi:hypothetical protein
MTMQQGPQGYGPPQGYPQQGYQQQPPKQGMPTWAKVLIALGVIGICSVGGCIVCVGVGAKATADAISEASASAKKADDAAKAATTKVAINQLLEDYKANEVRADESYKGKYIITAGQVGDVKKDILDDMYITLLPAGGNGLTIPAVQCHPPESEKAKLAALNKGQPVAVFGKVRGLMLHVQIDDCVLADKK